MQMDKLIADVQQLADIENEHTGLLSRPLLSYIKEWLALESSEMAAARGQSIFFTYIPSI